jgi:hypothetical protein
MSNTATGSQQPTSPQPGGSLRPIYIALILIISVIVGTAAGVLTFESGANIATAVLGSGASIATAVLAGGAAFAGTAMLLLALLKFAIGGSA